MNALNILMHSPLTKNQFRALYTVLDGQYRAVSNTVLCGFATIDIASHFCYNKARGFNLWPFRVFHLSPPLTGAGVLARHPGVWGRGITE